MDRIEFVQVNKLKDSVASYFDQAMALYNLIGDCTTISVCSYSECSAEFNVAVSNEQLANNMCSIMSDRIINSYGTDYKIQSSKENNNAIKLSLSKILI